MRAALIVMLSVATAWSIGGPIRTHKEPAQEEFKNVYQEITKVAAGNFSSGFLLGKIQQVLYYTTTTSSATASSGFVPTNSLGAITPSSTDSRVLACSFSVITDAGGTQGAQLAIFRDATNLCDATGCSQTIHSAGGSITVPVSMCVIDSPSSTSALSYSVRMLSSNPPATPTYGNGRTQTLILMEIGP